MIVLFYLRLFFYQIIIPFIAVFIRISALWNPKHNQWVKGRKDIFGKIAAALNPGEKRIWVHCSSLGEFEQGRPVIEQIKKVHPDYRILLTFFSPSGYEIRKNYAHADYVFYLPSDTIRNARRFIELTDPKLVIFVKYEYWYNYFHAVNRENIPLVLVSAIFHADKVFFKPWGILFRKMLQKIDHIFVQDQHSKQLLAGIGVDHVSIAPDTRIDRVLQISNEAWKSDMAEVEAFCGNSHVLIAGSSYSTEEELIFSLLQQPAFEWKVIIAPHNTDAEHIDKIRILFGKLAVCWSDVKKGVLPLPVSHYRIMIIDTIGLLAHLYKYASVAFIGGGFGKSIHNILEPATFGLPIIIGPKNHEKFREAVDLEKLGGIYIINNFEDFKGRMLEMLDDSKRASAGSTSRKYIMDHAGGTRMVMEGIGRFLE
jgi:3-deoxy-D-manno-octulosonic-acid transferase